MSEFFEIFQPGLRHLREQRELEMVLVVEDDQGGKGPKPLDLDSGHVVISVPEPSVEPECSDKPEPSEEPE